MRKLAFLSFIAFVSVCANAANYYVSASSGSDANPGTQTQPFQTLAKVNGLALSAGDNVYLKRGDTWNEQLIPPSSGTLGSSISFDAYGTGAAPVLSPIINLAGATWTHNSGNIYTTTLSTTIASPQINNLQLGKVWGRKRSPNPGCTSAGVILGYGDFCVIYPTLYLYSPNGTLPSAYYSSITPVVGQAGGLAMVQIAGKSSITVQHIKIQMFDYAGVGVTGASDNLVFANMEADGMVPSGTTPLGFYVNATNPTNIQFLNDDAHLNYDGFRFDGAATAITVTNCRGYANRDTGLKDNTGHATYSYSHFYGNNVAQLLTTDVAGGIAGSGNVALVCGAGAGLPAGMCSSMTAPVVNNFATYPARFSFTVDDVGSQPGTEAYINTFLASPSGPYYLRPSLRFNAAVVPSYAGQNGGNAVDWNSVNNWYASGHEIDSHSWSHQYYTTNTSPGNQTPYPNSPALVMQYTGSGTAATLTISGGTLSTTVTGASGDSISPAISLSSYTAQQLYAYLQSLPNYTVQQNSTLWATNGWPLSRPNTHAANFGNVAGQDIKSAPYAILYDQTLLLPDEMKSSQTAIQTNVPGLTEAFYVYPDGIQDPTAEVDAIAAGYTAARGSLAMKDQNNAGLGANSLYANGVNVQNITSLAASVHGYTQAQINQVATSLVFRAEAWGVPYGLFTHYNSRGDNTPDISNTELGYLLDAVTANGGTWMTNVALASAITATPANNLSGSTRYVQNPTGADVNLAVVGANSPGVAHGTATAYAVDLNGTNRATLRTWDIGASTYLSQRYGGGTGSGTTYIGGWQNAASGTNYAVKASGGGNYGTIQACVNAMSSGDTCTVYAGTYSENVTVPAGTAGSYKTITVNGADVVSVRSFTINSHVKIIGNCATPGAYGSCGFSLGNPSSPGGTCVSGTNNMTDYYIVGNTMEACTFIVTGPNGSNSSHGFIQKNTMAWSCSTPSAPNVCTAGQLRGNYILFENNDISHVSDGFYIAGGHIIYRKNNFHDVNSSDCGSNSSNCHVDFMQADANVAGGALPAQYLVFEKNISANMTGSNMHAIGLFQGEVCNGNCFNAIVRFHQAYHTGGAGIVDDNSEAACPAWSHVKSYNNDWIDMGGSSGGTINNTSYCSTNAAYLNDIYYWPGSVSNVNGYFTTGGGGSSTSPYRVGNNLAYCPGCSASSIHPHTYGSGSWTADSGNVLADPLFNNYAGNDFSLASSSPARNAGTSLTTVNGTVSGSTTLVVSDADYFQDGYTIPGVQGDCIAVTTIGNHVCITAVNYATNTLTLSSPISAANGDPVWIYSISDGSVVLTDSTGPDLGAVPYSSSSGSNVALPQNWVNSNEWIGTTGNAINFPATGTGGSWSCGAINYGPYTAGSQTSLQQAVNDAEACRTANGSGTKIVLPAGSVYSGGSGLSLPQTVGDSSTNFIVLTVASPLPTGRTVCAGGIQDNVTSAAQPGIRNVGCNGASMSYQLGTMVTPVSGAFTLANGTATNTSAYNDAGSMYTVECTSANCHAISTGSYDTNNVGPHHYAIFNGEIRPQAGLATANSIVKLGLQTETVSSQRASHIHVAYSYIHGDWSDAPTSGGVVTGPPTGANSIPADVAFSGCIYCSISYSYIDRSIRPGAEGHAIFLGYWDQIKVVHNWVEGSSIGLFSGGFASTVSLTGFGNDLEDRGNRYTYPYSWMLAFNAGYCVNGLSCSGNGYVRKNSHEFKNGNRVLDDGNINENVDNSGAQNGIAMSWKANNCSNGFCNNYWLSMQNLTRSNGLSRNTCQGMSWGFRSATDSNNGGGVVLPVQLALVRNNLSYNIDLNNPGCSSASPEEGFRINQAGTGNTWAASCTRDSAGATSSCSLTSIPGGTQADFSVGDPVYVSGCSDATFNTSVTAMGPAALPGTTASGLTVIYTNAGTANATTSGCTVSNLQGWPRYLTHTHNSEFINTSSASSPYSTAANGGVYQLGRNLSFTNDIFVGGGVTGGWSEGTRTETKSFDATTEVMNNNLFPGRDSAVTCPGHSSPATGGMAACYTEYSNSSVPSTPTSLYGVPTSYCTGNDPTTGNCVGVLGAMSQASFPLTLSDWHQYRLCHAGDAACNGKASLYASGQTNDASDGADIGADLAAIDAAQVSTQYVCQTACGSGPSVDAVSTGH